MKETFTTIFDCDHSTVGKEALTHEGCIVDIGCLGWEWSLFFRDKKRVIGIDPLVTDPNGFELFTGILGSFEGTTNIIDRGEETSKIRSFNETTVQEKEVSIISWKKFCRDFKINSVSVLKINIEGGEYSLLTSLDSEDYSKIDQIAISFHHWLNPNWKHLTQACLTLLELEGYSVTQINERYGWYLARR